MPTRGKEVFNKIGCATCHRPSWETKEDNYWAPKITKGRQLPRYRNQKIYPYSDMLQHRLYMKNGIHGSWCRTTPLWGRGLFRANTEQRTGYMTAGPATWSRRSCGMATVARATLLNLLKSSTTFPRRTATRWWNSSILSDPLPLGYTLKFLPGSL